MKRRRSNDPEAEIRRDLAVKAHRIKLARWEAERSRPEYFAFRMGLIQHNRAEGLRPFEVAALLEQHAAEFSEIEQDEIDAYRAMGSTWQAWTPTRVLMRDVEQRWDQVAMNEEQ